METPWNGIGTAQGAQTNVDTKYNLGRTVRRLGFARPRIQLYPLEWIIGNTTTDIRARISNAQYPSQLHIYLTPLDEDKRQKTVTLYRTPIPSWHTRRRSSTGQLYLPAVDDRARTLLRLLTQIRSYTQHMPTFSVRLFTYDFENENKKKILQTFYRSPKNYICEQQSEEETLQNFKTPFCGF